MTDKTEQSENTEQSISEQARADNKGSGGMRARRAFLLKNLLTGDPLDWIAKNVVGGGKGTQKMVGRVFGVCTGSEKKSNMIGDKMTESIVLYGQFEYESLVSGEVGSSSSVYLPMAYAQQVAAQFADESVKMVEVDVDIGLEATGKAIPYEWLVINHTAEGEASLIKKLRNRRRPGQAALAAPSNEPAQLEAPKQEAAEAEKQPARSRK